MDIAALSSPIGIVRESKVRRFLALYSQSIPFCIYKPYLIVTTLNKYCILITLYFINRDFLSRGWNCSSSIMKVKIDYYDELNYTLSE